MKQLVLALFLCLLSVANLSADTTAPKAPQKVELVIRARSNNEKGQRMPLRLSIDVTYDFDTRTLEVVSDRSLLGEDFILLDGNVIDYSPVVPSVFYIPEMDGTFTIEIEGETWIATGTIPA